MIKRLYLANGSLLAALDKTSSDVAVDASIAALLATLGIGDHCYLTLIYGDAVEVIKIRKDYSGFQVDRAQAGTSRYSFPAGTLITYRLTDVEILDAVSASTVNIYSAGIEYITVTNSNGVWTIDVPGIQAETVGGVETVTEGNKLGIFDRIGMFGCCDSGLSGAPHIPGPFFYLTSMLYPQESVEYITPNPRDKLGNPIPPINFDLPWWLLTQPSSIEKYVSHGMDLLDWQQFGGEKSFSAPIEKYILPGILVGAYGDWNKFGGEADFTAPPEKYIARNCYPLEMLLFGGDVQYNRGVEKYVLPTINLLDWTLS